jgi:hypothetical protein
MRQLKIYYTKQGGHYHCRVFIGVYGQTFAKVGDLVFSEEDWVGLKNTFAHSTIFIEDTKG